MNNRQLFITTLLLFFCLTKTKAQENKHWSLMKNELLNTIAFSNSTTKNIEDYSFKAKWDNKLSYSDNLGHYGGISELIIFKDNKEQQRIKNIEDGIGLGKIRFTFYDYNMDGYLDFTISINCGKSCYDAYYLFNPTNNKFIHYKEWDYLRILKLNKKEKQILSVSDGNAMNNNQKLYQVKGYKLKKL